MVKCLREEGEAREVHDDEDFTGGTVIIRVDLSKSCESLRLELNQHRLYTKKRSEITFGIV